MTNNATFVLLAGGQSKRMGIPKGLLPYQDSYWILEQIDRISKSSITEIYIGLGHHYLDYLEKISWFSQAELEFVLYKNLKVKIAINPNPEQGSFSTLQTVLHQIPKNQSILINPIDIPILNKHDLQSIIDTQNQIVLPHFKNKNGHPIKLHPKFWNHLLLLDPKNENSRLDLEIKKAKPLEITRIETLDHSILINLNTPENWTSYMKTTNS